MFAIADAVHNLTDVLEPDTDATLASRLYADDPAAQEWIRDQLAAFEDSRAGVPDVALRWNREGICPRWPDPYAAHPDRLRVSPMS